MGAARPAGHPAKSLEYFGTTACRRARAAAARVRRARALSLHPRATMTEFQEHLADLYHVAIAPECISAVTDEMLGAVTILQQRSPESPTILGQVSASHYDQGSMASLWHVQSPCAASTL